MLSEHYDLALIEVRLAFEVCDGSPRPIVCVRLEIGGETLVEASVTTEEMQLPATLAAVANKRGMQGICMPERVSRPLADALRAKRPGQPAWLRVASPAAHLPAVPWELVLQPVLGVPLLRLPESLVTPVASTTRIDIALCVTEPVEKAYDAIGHLRRLVRQLGDTLEDRTHLHVFSNSAAARAELRRAATPRVTVYEPDAAAWQGLDESSSTGSCARGLVGRVESPWLRWVMDALSLTSVDIVHFACPGYLSAPYGALDLGLSPLGEQDDRFSRIVTAAELLAFMTRIGAWGVGFTIPAQYAWPAGVRLLAHRVAQLNPGPVVVEAPHYAPDGDSGLHEAYRLLFGDVAAAPPATPACSIYVNPGRVREAAGKVAGDAERRFETLVHERVGTLTLESDPTADLLGGGAKQPGWVAANQRTLERWAATVIAPQVEGGHRSAIVSGLDDALTQVSEIVARHAREEGKRS
jgi:hypothetical protein